MPELQDKLLHHMGTADVLAFKAKQTAQKLQQAASKHHDATGAQVDDLAKQIAAAGVGNNPDLEEQYCQALVTRSRMAQAHTLSEQDACRMPEVGEHLEKGQQSLPLEDLEKGPKPNFVPPDVPRWRSKPPAGERFLPLNGVEDRPKFWGMVKEMRSGDWEWHVPLIRCGDQLLTGSHRYAAANEAGVPLKTIPIDRVFREAGLDFKQTWEANAQPFVSWLSNMDYAVQQLPEDLRAKYGIDLG